ncbi:uncharacterized protein At4g18257-like [Punica granatum]|uniref:Uncharacterized protein n=2 Tax=Punica granatum TaxID=22663 RepID=A0A218VTS3_PUNGR|nr:uncharacterized protein At4g18257-like [Punica granatum]OWM63895.1 hypothetical protein CDL15_Pgr006157 [Punica granatum]PKI67979.1 hypothetical protein CRG98_011575 [Punica granatum]
MAEEEGKKKRVAVESLGWLTESSIMPKKHREIAGVGATSILELKAQLYRSQEDVKKSKELGAPDAEFHRARKILPAPNLFSAKNSGVEARALKDKLELKAVKDGTNSYEALERKAQLYEKLVRGELSDEEDKEKYCVDFFQKNLEHSEEPQSRGHENPAAESSENDDDNDAPELFNTKVEGPGRTSRVLDNDEHRRFVREVHAEVNQAREKASELKQRRQEQATARREKLRQAYLKKQLEKLRAGSTTTEKT